jgi:NAD(P)H-dependent FMN reductase
MASHRPISSTSLPITYPCSKSNTEKVKTRSKVFDDIQEKLDQADASVFLSPEYHGSYSGALKNAVDYFSTEFRRKPIGVVAVGAGRMGGINASTEMQQLVLYSWVPIRCPINY